jgi:mannose-6-phosphate isomerase-like protein (cupin superfamily)
MNQHVFIDSADLDFRIFSMQIDTSNMRPLIDQLLPDQGCIEVQRDVPGKEHAWHTHETDETLVIIDGSVRFYWDQGEKICGPGTVISLPAGTPHGSVALEDGATYLIAFHAAKFTHHHHA